MVSLPEELDDAAHLPPEIAFLLKNRANVKERLRDLLTKGKAIGVRTVDATPANVLAAVHAISVHTQHNCVLTWLPELLRDRHLPVITATDRERATKDGADLDAAVRLILEHRLKCKRLVLVDEDNIGIGTEQQRLMTELSELLYPLAIDHIVHRLIADNAGERTETAQKILKALLIIGPIAHVLEKFAAGIGKVFAASTDDILGEVAELSALRGSGFGWLTLAKRLYVLTPIFALATVGAFHVETLIAHGHTLAGGALFGLCAVALSLTTAIQSVGLYRGAIRNLKKEGKLHDHHTHGGARSEWTLALIQDFSNPARFGLLLGAAFAPVVGMIAASLQLFHNGWILALVGSTESVVAGLTVLFANRISEYRFKKKMERRVRMA